MLSAMIEESIVVTEVLEWQKCRLNKGIQRFQVRFEVGWNIEIHVSDIAEETES